MDKIKISFGFVVQLLSIYILVQLIGLKFENALIIAVVIEATSNFFINNWFTFAIRRLNKINLLWVLLRFLMVSSLPIIANVGLAIAFYKIYLQIHSYLNLQQLLLFLLGITQHLQDLFGRFKYQDLENKLTCESHFLFCCH